MLATLAWPGAAFAGEGGAAGFTPLPIRSFAHDGSARSNESAWSSAPLSRLRLLDAGELAWRWPRQAAGGQPRLPERHSPGESLWRNAGERPDDARRLAAIEIALVAGAKTYWRDPGEAGLAPRFDWSASENLAAVEVLWPAPRLFDEGGARAVGYVEDVLLPLIVTPSDPTKPVLLALRADYGACATQCVPSRGDARLRLVARAEGNSQRVRVDEAARGLPLHGVLLPRVRSVGLVGDALVVDAEGGCWGRLEALAEGPEGWSFGPAAAPPCPTYEGGWTQASGATRAARLVLPVRARPPGPPVPSAAISVLVTLIEDNRAVERRLTLDAAPHAP